jgi:GT2 family glycosyltransferase
MKEQFFVTVCTLGENKNLKNCVDALARIKENSTKKIEILIVFNHPRRESDYAGSVNLVFESSKGYSNVRNRAIKSLPVYANLIFLDDDEVPTIEWFESMAKMHETFPDDLIVGPVLPYEKSEGQSYRKIRSEKNSRIVNGSVVKHGGAGNMLIPWNLLKGGNVSFDTYYNFSGSEDTDFCVRMRKNSVKIRFASDAVLYEKENPIRFKKEYIDARFIRDIANYSVVIRRNENFLAIVNRMIVLIIRIILFVPLSIFSNSFKIKLKAYAISFGCLMTGKVRTLT